MEFAPPKLDVTGLCYLDLATLYPATSDPPPGRQYLSCASLQRCQPLGPYGVAGVALTLQGRMQRLGAWRVNILVHIAQAISPLLQLHSL